MPYPDPVVVRDEGCDISLSINRDDEEVSFAMKVYGLCDGRIVIPKTVADKHAHLFIYKMIEAKDASDSSKAGMFDALIAWASDMLNDKEKLL